MDKQNELKQTVVYHFLDKAFATLRENNNVFHNFVESEQRVRTIVEKPLRLAVMGEFSTGKSSFLNRLLGMDILPTGVMPVTSIVTVLEYSEEQKLELLIKEPSGNITTKQYDGYTNLKKWQKASKEQEDLFQIKQITVYLENDYLRYFTILDTPGLNDPTNYGELTRALFEKVNFVIWLFKANQAGTRTERTYLEEFIAKNPYKNNIYAVINYGDMVAGNEQEYYRESVSIAESLKENFGDYFINDRIFLISATSKDSFWEKVFLDFLSDLKEKVLRKDLEISREQLNEEYIRLKQALEQGITKVESIYSDLRSMLTDHSERESCEQINLSKRLVCDQIETEIINSVKKLETRLQATTIYKNLKLNSVLRLASYFFTGQELIDLKAKIGSYFKTYIMDFFARLETLKGNLENRLTEYPFPHQLLEEDIRVTFDKLLSTLRFLSTTGQLLIVGYLIGLLSDDFIFKNVQKSPHKLINRETIKNLVGLDTDLSYFNFELQKLKDSIEKKINYDINTLVKAKDVLEELGGK